MPVVGPGMVNALNPPKSPTFIDAAFATIKNFVLRARELDNNLADAAASARARFAETRSELELPRVSPVLAGGSLLIIAGVIVAVLLARGK